jgi:hypothetical protein
LIIVANNFGIPAAAVEDDGAPLFAGQLPHFAKQPGARPSSTFKEGGMLKTFDYVVANPPFSDKRRSTGLEPLNDVYEGLKPFGTPLRSA